MCKIGRNEKTKTRYMCGPMCIAHKKKPSHKKKKKKVPHRAHRLWSNFQRWNDHKKIESGIICA